MIYTERVINVKNGTATIDQPIVLFRGDRNIEIVFEIVNSKFKFSEKGNYILDIGAKYGQLAVDMPDGTDLFTEIAECMDGKVIFKITGDMINEIAENGFYSFHVRLFNEDKTSRVTIPPIMEGIEVREPIVIEGDGIFPIVDMGTSDVAVIDSDKETFIDENGKLNIEWKNGDIISSTRLNQMVEYINDMEDKLVSEDNLAKYATIEHVDVIEEQMEAEIAGLTNMLSAVDTTASSAMTIAQDARETVNGKYNELNDKLFTQQNALERVEATVANAEANAAAALAEVKTFDNRIDKNATDIYDIYDKLDLNYVHVDTMNYQHGLLQTDINQNKANIEAHAERLQTLEEADGVDLSGYATIEFVNLKDGELSVEIQQSVEAVNGRLDAIDTSIEELNTEVFTTIDEEIGELQNGIADHEVRITALEQADGNDVDLSGYATTEYVDGQIGTLNDRIDILDNEIADAGVDMLREDLEAVRAIAEEGMSEEKRAEFRSGIMDSVVTDFIDPLNETVEGHNERITALEEAGGGNVDLTGYATTEYVDGQISEIQTAIEILPDDPANPALSECITRQYVVDNYTPKALYTMLSQTVSSIQTAIEILPDDPANPGLDECITTECAVGRFVNKFDFITANAKITRLEEALGDINSILDAINGEVI